MNFFRTILVAVLLQMTPAWASPVKVVELIEERALAELSHVIPEKSQIAVRMAEGVISEGTFIQEFWIDADTGQFIANVVQIGN